MVEEELNTVVVPKTLEHISEEIRHMFLERLDALASTVFIRDADPHIEFLEAKSRNNSTQRTCRVIMNELYA